MDTCSSSSFAHYSFCAQMCVHAQVEGIGQPPSTTCQPWCIPVLLVSIWEATQSIRRCRSPWLHKNPGVQGMVPGNGSTFLVALDPELTAVSCWILFVVCVCLQALCILHTYHYNLPFVSHSTIAGEFSSVFKFSSQKF